MTSPPLRIWGALSGNYRLEDEIGAGGMATVYLAEDLRHDRQVAEKIGGRDRSIAVETRTWRSLMRTMGLTGCLLVALVTTSAAQTPMKLAGKMECAKPEPNYMVPVADTAKHAISLGTAKCTWSEGTIGGERLKDEEDTFSSDATGNSSQDRGYGVGSAVNGDKYFVHFKGTSTLKDGAPLSGACT